MTERVTIEVGHQGYQTMFIDGIELEGSMMLIDGEWYVAEFTTVSDDGYDLFVTVSDSDGQDFEFNIHEVEQVKDGFRVVH